MIPVTVLIVDDLDLMRRGMRSMLKLYPQIHVVGDAADGREAVSLVASLRPAVVLMDIKMPLVDGLEATRLVKATHPTTAVIMMTTSEDDALVLAAIRAGAAGYLLKDASPELLLTTIDAVAKGGMLVSASLLRRAIEGVALEDPGDEPPALRTPTEPLTEREVRVLELITEGRTNREIGAALFLTQATVKRDVQSIIAKLRASDRTHAVITAMRLALIA